MIAVDGIFSDPKNHKTMPGPGQYPIQSPRHPVAYSFRIRHGTGSSKDMVPGPGNYPVSTTISKDGKYVLSKF